MDDIYFPHHAIVVVVFMLLFFQLSSGILWPPTHLPAIRWVKMCEGGLRGVSIMVSNSLVIALPLVGIASWVLMPRKPSLISLIYLHLPNFYCKDNTHQKGRRGKRSKLPNGLNCKHQATSSWLQVPRAQ
jgi:hypothetical protein